MTDPKTMTLDECVERLCLCCGICCDGVLFGDVRIPDPGEARRLSAAGLPVRQRRMGSSTGACLQQPCPALGKDNVCGVYRQRPTRCRQFECALFKQLLSGATTLPQAKRIVRGTLDQAEGVKDLLRFLGEAHEGWALARRFRVLKRDLPRRTLTEELAGVFADLSLRVHDLNMTLRLKFYPETREDNE
jgi:uncharacterized protein